MYTITYNLKNDFANSDNYYTYISLFTDEVLHEGKSLLDKPIKAYREYIKASAARELRSINECTLELLILGTLWQVYSGDALGLDKMPQKVLSGLSRLRQQGGTLKPGIDFLRGILSTIFLSPDLYDNMFSLDPTAENLEKLLDWLDATGEFKYEIKRLRLWQSFLMTLPNTLACDILASSITFSMWFEDRSEEALGAYTLNVERYLNEIRPSHYWHEDVIFCGRRRVEYHLNMVGAEIMNRAFKKAFSSAGKKLVLLPGCTRLLPASKCKAMESGNALYCTGCSKECGVLKLVTLGKKSGFEVAIVSHESSISANKGSNNYFDKDTGVIGVACVLNLISGGLMLRDMGVPAQCVLLDYCGCKNHWHKEGIPTEINLAQLEQILKT